MVSVFKNLKLKKRSDLHLARKIWHITGVFAMFVVWNLADKSTSMIILSVACLAFVAVDILRAKLPALNEFIVFAFKPIMRESEVNRIAGTSYLLTGVMVCALLFPHEVVSLTLLFLGFADPIASFVGILYGKDKIFGQKSLQGTLAGYLVCVTAGVCYLYSKDIPVDRILVFSFIAGLIGALAELIPVGKLDDNFTMPVISATGLSILFYLFGLYSYFV